jgi:hypothetical protein
MFYNPVSHLFLYPYKLVGDSLVGELCNSLFLIMNGKWYSCASIGKKESRFAYRLSF